METVEQIALKRAYSYDQYREYYNRVCDDHKHISFDNYRKLQRNYEAERLNYYNQARYATY